jgi:hypothetical protein
MAAESYEYIIRALRTRLPLSKIAAGKLLSTGYQIHRDDFAGKKVLVVGDLMLDRYITGDVTRISPEAPVPMLGSVGHCHGEQV